MGEHDLDLCHSVQKATLPFTLTFYISAVFTGGTHFKSNSFFSLEKPKANFKSKIHTTYKNHGGRKTSQVFKKEETQTMLHELPDCAVPHNF